MSTRIQLKNVRISYPYLFEPNTGPSGKDNPRYTAEFLIPKTDEAQLDLVEGAIEAAIDQKWKGKRPSKLTDERLFLLDGDELGKENTEGHWVVRAASRIRPTVVNKDRTPLTAADGVIYGGCRVNAIIEAWGQDNEYGVRVNAELKGVQFANDDVSFGGGGTPVRPEDFEDTTNEPAEDEPPKRASRFRRG